MAGSKTAYLAQKLLDHCLGGAAFVQPGTVYLCLSTAAFSPTATGSAMSEVAAADYARLAVANDGTQWSAASAAAPSEKHNLADLAFPTATSDWGTPLSAYLADALAGGNLLYGTDLNSPAQAIPTGDTVKIPAGTFILEED